MFLFVIVEHIPNLLQSNPELVLSSLQLSYLAFQWPYYCVISIKCISEHRICVVNYWWRSWCPTSSNILISILINILYWRQWQRTDLGRF